MKIHILTGASILAFAVSVPAFAQGGSAIEQNRANNSATVTQSAPPST